MSSDDSGCQAGQQIGLPDEHFGSSKKSLVGGIGGGIWGVKSNKTFSFQYYMVGF